MFARLRPFAPLLLLATLGCSSEDALSANTVAEVVTHGLGASQVLSANLAVATLLPDQARSLDLESDRALLQGHLDARADGESTAQVTLSDDAIAVSLSAFPLFNARCEGHFFVVSSEHCAFEGADVGADAWCLEFPDTDGADDEGLRCDGRSLHGYVSYSPARENGHAYTILEGRYSDIVSGFLGFATVARSAAAAHLVVSADVRFVDAGMGLWRGEAIGLELQAMNDKSRGGTLILLTPNDKLFATGWSPIGERSALVTVSRGSQTWTGCVESANSGECAAASEPKHYE